MLCEGSVRWAAENVRYLRNRIRIFPADARIDDHLCMNGEALNTFACLFDRACSVGAGYKRGIPRFPGLKEEQVTVVQPGRFQSDFDFTRTGRLSETSVYFSPERPLIPSWMIAFIKNSLHSSWLC